MLHGEAYAVGEKTYVFNQNGTLANGWTSTSSNTGTTWMYAKADGTAWDGWLYSGGHWYYIRNGYMVANDFVTGGYWIGANGIWK